MSGKVSIFNINVTKEKEILDCHDEINSINTDKNGDVISICEGTNVHIYRLKTETSTTIQNSYGLYFEDSTSKIAVLEMSGIKYIESI